MDELEWLREHTPPTRPSRDITRRHRTQLRAAIAAEGADGTRPRRPRRERRSRHRVLVTTAVVVVLCAAGAGVVALTSSGGDGGSTVGAPAASAAATTAAPAQACAGAPPKELAIPAGFGNAVAAPAKQATTAPASTQQVTSWTSDQATIEQRWPGDAAAVAKLGGALAKGDTPTFVADQNPISDGKSAMHRTILIGLPGQSGGCEVLQVTVYGSDAQSVNAVTDQLLMAPFRSSEPLVTTTATASVAPNVIACAGPAQELGERAVPVVATVGDKVAGGTFAKPADALVDFLPGHRTLFQHGYQELDLTDSTVAYVKVVAGNTVTVVHVAPTPAGWTVTDWQASGC